MQSEPVDYTVDGALFRGHWVNAANAGVPLPGLVMAPNWMGVTPDSVERAQRLAMLGYAVLVADVYGADRRPKDFEEAARLALPVRADPQLARRRMRGALAALEREGASRGALMPDLRAAVGFCFGGGNVLELARDGAPLQAVVSLHGDLTTPQPAAGGAIQAAVLALHGADDIVSPKTQRDAFEAEMNACGARWQLVVFGRVLHAYTDVGVDAPPVARYDAYAAERSYDMTHQFITDAFARRV